MTTLNACQCCRASDQPLENIKDRHRGETFTVCVDSHACQIRTLENNTPMQMGRDVQRLILEHGADSLLFMIPVRPVRSVFGMISYTSSQDPAVVMPCVVDDHSRESYNP